MTTEEEMREIERAGVKFRDKTEVTLDDFDHVLGQTPVEVVSNDSPKPPSAQDLRDRAEREEAERAKAEAKREARRRQDRRIRAERWDSTIPAVWRGAKLNDLAPDIATGVQKWIDRPDDRRWSMILYGPTGVGKTFTLYCVAREMWIDRYDIEIVEAKVLLDLLRPSQSGDPQAMLERIKTVEVLCLDDLGSEKVNDWTTERLEIIFNYRWERQLATVITSNIEPREFAELFGQRTASRLIGGSALIKVTGKDKRIHG